MLSFQSLERRQKRHNLIPLFTFQMAPCFIRSPLSLHFIASHFRASEEKTWLWSALKDIKVCLRSSKHNLSVNKDLFSLQLNGPRLC
ncbi:hypothetical protein GDO81_010760 [Engystomops pustulosus]|uniref:Uncharacterized protein n=1 Tax=Engystomops pustulosus TaxID=76066 RepID=A0AAV7C453_ENGPU|nr:hypothetical protein GDO81_010760 [Engystomops pustulosus]